MYTLSINKRCDAERVVQWSIWELLFPYTPNYRTITFTSPQAEDDSSKEEGKIPANWFLPAYKHHSIEPYSYCC